MRTGFAGGLHFTDDRQDNVSIDVDQIPFRFICIVIAGRSHLGHGKGSSQFRLLAANGDVELVVLLDCRLVVIFELFLTISTNILDIKDFLRTNTRRKKCNRREGAYDKYEGNKFLFHSKLFVGVKIESETVAVAKEKRSSPRTCGDKLLLHAPAEKKHPMPQKKASWGTNFRYVNRISQKHDWKRNHCPSLISISFIIS